MREVGPISRSCMESSKLETSLGTGHLLRGGGGLQNGKIAGPKLFTPPPQDRLKLFVPPPPFKEWKLLVPPLQYG